MKALFLVLALVSPAASASQLCEEVSKMASNIMQIRQMGMSLNDALELIKGAGEAEPLAKKMVMVRMLKADI